MANRPVRRWPVGWVAVKRARTIATAAVSVIVVSAAVFAPVPNSMALRDWASALGGWFTVAFLAAYVVVTVFPFPRTAFTLSAGLLFGPVLGATLAVLASTTSALIAMLAVRATGYRLGRLVSHPTIDGLNARLRQRGWPAIVSLRLIPAVPFSVLNYAAGASAVRMGPYLAATFVGLLPGTVAVVILGDALTGRVNPLLVVVSCITAVIGVTGLALELRSARALAPPPSSPQTSPETTPPGSRSPADHARASAREPQARSTASASRS